MIQQIAKTAVAFVTLAAPLLAQTAPTAAEFNRELAALIPESAEFVVIAKPSALQENWVAKKMFGFAASKEGFPRGVDRIEAVGIAGTWKAIKHLQDAPSQAEDRFNEIAAQLDQNFAPREIPSLAERLSGDVLLLIRFTEAFGSQEAFLSNSKISYELSNVGNQEILKPVVAKTGVQSVGGSCSAMRIDDRTWAVGSLSLLASPLDNNRSEFHGLLVNQEAIDSEFTGLIFPASSSGEASFFFETLGTPSLLRANWVQLSFDAGTNGSLAIRTELPAAIRNTALREFENWKTKGPELKRYKQQLGLQQTGQLSSQHAATLVDELVSRLEALQISEDNGVVHVRVPDLNSERISKTYRKYISTFANEEQSRFETLKSALD